MLCLIITACGTADRDVFESDGANEGSGEQVVEDSSADTSTTSSTAADETDETLPTETTEETAPPAKPPSDDSQPDENDSRVELARADLAARLERSVSDVAVVRVEEVEWPDTSLGCPDPKKSYAQMIVNGYDIVLEVDSMEYHYHGASGQDPFYCAIPTS